MARVHSMIMTLDSLASDAADVALVAIGLAGSILSEAIAGDVRTSLELTAGVGQ